AFDLDALPARAILRYTALGIVEPWLNGRRLGDEVLAPGWTSYTHRVIVSSTDVTDLLVVGENVLGAIVGAGWAAGRLGWDGRRGVYVDRPAVWLSLELELADGSARRIASGPGFRAATGAIVADDLYDGEHYDARRHPRGWDSPGFDDAGWHDVETVEWDPATREDRSFEPIREIETLRPVTITHAASGAHIVDFGQNFSGWVRLRVTGAAGTEIVLRHGELLTPDGELETVNLRTARATYRYVLDGSGVETWEPRFTFHGFRYAEVSGWPGELDAGDIEGVVVHTDMVRRAWLRTSDPLLNQLHENTVWGMRGNFVGLPTDCPQRDERLGWTGDINAFGPTAASLYDVRGILRSWLADVAAEQREFGSVPWYVPQITGAAQSPTALWGDVVISLPWALYREYGDASILTANYPAMRAFAAEVEAQLRPSGLWADGFQFGDWLDPDAPGGRPQLAKAEAPLVATAYFVRVVRELAQVADVLGDTTAAQTYTALAAHVRDGFRHEYVAPSGRLANESATSYALAIRFGLLEPDETVRAGARLAAKVAEGRFRISTGFAGTPHVLDALIETGHDDEAFQLLLQTEAPSFLYPVTQGATTIWERWDAVRPDGTLHPSSMTSLNHYALGAVTDWMHRTIGGVAAIEPGYRRFHYAPRIGGGLTHAQVRHDTAFGPIEGSWTLTDDVVSLELTVPEGAVATVIAPGHPEGLTAECGPGVHAWTYERPRVLIPPFDLESPLGEVVAFPEAWDAVAGVLVRHLPHLAELLQRPTAEGAEADRSLRWALGMIPGTTPALEEDVTAALRALADAGSV
ncbi:glycoside hydrolase family 78 protein, partial [Streptomyces sp. G2]|uniref:alpha-L-rhamnosidase n=1 Tax=Streptomyces sp. G2 TaxID=1684471 RepID=UPI00202E0867